MPLYIRIKSTKNDTDYCTIQQPHQKTFLYFFAVGTCKFPMVLKGNYASPVKPSEYLV